MTLGEREIAFFFFVLINRQRKAITPMRDKYGKMYVRGKDGSIRRLTPKTSKKAKKRESINNV